MQNSTMKYFILLCLSVCYIHAQPVNKMQVLDATECVKVVTEDQKAVCRNQTGYDVLESIDYNHITEIKGLKACYVECELKFAGHITINGSTKHPDGVVKPEDMCCLSLVVNTLSACKTYQGDLELVHQISVQEDDDKKDKKNMSPKDVFDMLNDN